MKKRKAGTFGVLDVITKEQFKVIEASFMAKYQMPLECNDLEGREVLGRCSLPYGPYYCRLIRESRNGANRCRQERIRSMNLAIETGQPSIRICHAGLATACVPIMDGPVPLGGLFFGKCLWEEPTEEFLRERPVQMPGLYYNYTKLFFYLEEMPVIKPRTIYAAAEYLYILLYETTGLMPYIPSWRRLNTEQKTEDATAADNGTTMVADSMGPYEDERRLILRIKIGDQPGAKEILNAMLGGSCSARPAGWM